MEDNDEKIGEEELDDMDHPSDDEDIMEEEEEESGDEIEPSQNKEGGYLIDAIKSLEERVPISQLLLSQTGNNNAKDSAPIISSLQSNKDLV